MNITFFSFFQNLPLLRIGFLLSALTLITGCGTTATQTTYFTAYNSATKSRNYYRVRVTAHTDDGTSSWQTGWYSRRALDEIFSEITTNSASVSDNMVDTYEKAFLNLFTQYTGCLETNNFPAALQTQRSMNELINAAGIYLSAGATIKDAAENAGKRYVYTFTADPTLLERMISDALNADQTSAALTGLITANSPSVQQNQKQIAQFSIDYEKSKNMAKRVQEAIDATASAIANFATLTNDQKTALVAQLTLLLNAAESN